MARRAQRPRPVRAAAAANPPASDPQPPVEDRSRLRLAQAAADEVGAIEATVSPEDDDIRAAEIRAQQLRAGNRRAANERTPRLDYPKRQGWYRVWCNNRPGNIERLIERGFAFVIDPVSKERVSRAVGVAEGGGAQLGFLMEIPLIIYDEDRAAIKAENDRIDSQIHRGAIDGELAEKELTIPKNPDGSPRIQIRDVRPR